MKYFILIISLFISSNGYSFELMNFCRQDLTRNLCLKAFLTTKCLSYSAEIPSVRRNLSCQNSINSFVDLLDIGSAPVIKNEKLHEEVIFKNELHQLITHPKTYSFLIKLKKEMDLKLENNKPFLLWDTVLSLSNNERPLALRRIAVLFQDASTIVGDVTSESTQIRYLKSIPAFKTELKTILLLNEILSYFSPYALSQLPLIKVYPLELQNILNPTFYHFYTILYSTEKLSKLNHSKEMSFFIPFLFNTQYEFKDSPGWPLKDPDSSSISSEWKVKEIYAGYIASMFGVQKKPISYEQFKKQLLISPYDFLRSLFFTRFSKDSYLSYNP